MARRPPNRPAPARGVPVAATVPDSLDRHESLLLLAALLLPNLGALACGFVYDDVPQIVDNPRAHSLADLNAIWSSGYWSNLPGPSLYRPLSVTLWASLWTIGGGGPLVFHAVGLALGAAVVLLLHRFLLVLGTPRRPAFLAAALFALFPIHTEATTSVVGSAEVLAAAFGLASLILFWQRRRVTAVALLTLAMLSKESAAALVPLAAVLAWTDRARRRVDAGDVLAAVATVLVVGGLLLAQRLVRTGPGFVPTVDNPLVLLALPFRILGALWIQCLYLWKTFVPVTLSADYSYAQIPLVTNLGDPRAWAGVALVVLVGTLLARRRDLRRGLVIYAVLFAPTANILFPIGTMMGERLAYLPSAGLALVAASALARHRRWPVILGGIALLYGVRSAVRNRDWRNPAAFYTALVETSPRSAKAHFFYGLLQAGRGDDLGAVAAYDRALEIFPAYATAYLNRGNALARLGRPAEAIASYRDCLRFDPTNASAADAVRVLERGETLYPPRRPL